MKLLFTNFKRLLFLSLIGVYTINAQGVYTPLNLQGMDRFGTIGARAAAMGGASVAAGNDVTGFFTNPASLLNVDNLSVKAGGAYSINQYDQVQDWTPNKLYAELSLIFRNDDTYKTKPFDNIKPGWNTKLSKGTPSVFAAAMPVKLGNIEITFGLGYAQYLNLNHYYQNNNSLDPNIGQMRPAPIPRLLPGDSLKVKWYQNYNKREGAIYGITPALNINIFSNFSAAVSAAILNGSTDDYEFRMDRGLFTLRYNNQIVLEQANYIQTKSGTSDYKGTMLNIGLLYNDERFSAGVSIKPPFTIKRSWSRTSGVSNANGTTSVMESGNDEIKYPALYTLGFAIYPTKNMTIGIDYEIRKMEKTEFTNLTDSLYNPWLSGNILKAGVEYSVNKYLKLRGGYREEAQIFEPEGTALLGEPVTGSVYSVGFGLNIQKILFDFSYQYTTVRYEDTWLSNNNTNKIERHSFMFEVGYNF